MGMTYFSSTTKEQYDAYSERPDLVETITLYTAPQPTDPIKPNVSFDDPRVQKVYEIICGDNHPPAGEHWDGYVSRLIVDALFSGEPVEPEGWKLVPVGLTHIMMYAGVAEWLTRDDPEEDVQGIWEAMLAAAPKFAARLARHPE